MVKFKELLGREQKLKKIKFKMKKYRFLNFLICNIYNTYMEDKSFFLFALGGRQSSDSSTLTLGILKCRFF